MRRLLLSVTCAVALGAIYFLLALLSALDARTRAKLQPRPLGYERTPVDGEPPAKGPRSS